MTEFASRADLIASYQYGSEQPYWALLSQEERDKAAASGAAMKDGSYPILTCEGDNSVDTAIHAVGRGGASHDAIRKHIMTRAKSLGCSSKIPDNWNSDGSLKTGAANVAALADAPAPAAPVEKPAPGEDAQAGPDDSIKAKIDAAVAAVQAAIEAQQADPDNDTDPHDAAVMTDLQTAADALTKAAKDQEVDESDDPTAETHTAAAEPGAEEAPQTVPAKGDQDPDLKCANPACTHPASVHQNTGEGANTGACTTPGCDCPGLTVKAVDQQETPGEVEDTNTAAGVLMPPAPSPVPADDSGQTGATVESNPAPPVPGGENTGPAFTIPVGVIEGQPTGDGRQIAPNALTWRTPPMPLMFMPTSSHDPAGMSPNDPAVICGRIDSLERVPGEGETQLIVAKGFFLANEDGQAAAELVEQMGRVGISADIAAQAEETAITEIDQDGYPIDMTSTLTEGVIMGFTMLPFPAFAGCYIVLGDGTGQEPIPQQTDDQTASGGQQVHWMTFEECRACDLQDGEVLVAAGGPVRPPAAWFENPRFEEGDGRMVEIYTKRGQTQWACPLTITEDGRVYGHLAPWGVCHIGFGNKCITPPRSSTDYAHFKRGEVLTAEGEYISVGVLTADTGHASLAAGSGGAMAHYDDTGTVTAFVNAGEDEYGIWLAGAIDPDATEQQVSRLRACGVSGDWRNRELVAALSVPTPGYPLARVQGRQEALVAAGASVMWATTHQAEETEPGVDHALRASLAPLVAQSGDLVRDRIRTAAAERARKRIARR